MMSKEKLLSIMIKQYCIECGRIIPLTRIKIFKKRGVITCSKKCSTHRSLTAYKQRKNG